eukprot:CAMPEP_0197715878 /NCGR_PEP_ID=MMETSP1434-20131217/953_1 /TAXON_ID=265543 /ORGANISM="Minutocellus polymorphus, Strain CCMP3303" /LENGTH=135 /DNA_ID=CAMNT_0043300133 /DNA_START=77 /DNA_END=484 /DNA_ORIENTATION=+
MSSSLTRIAPSVARCTAARFSLASASAQSSSRSGAAAIASMRTRPSSSSSSSARAFSNTAKPSKAADTGASAGGDRPIPGHNMGPVLFGVAVATFGIVGASVTDWNLTHDKSNEGLKRSATEYFDLERKHTEPSK